MTATAVSERAARRKPPVAHNLQGQKLGRKGRVTRERILSAMRELLAEEGSAAVSLSAVARRADLGMSTLYVYFKDLTELVLATLEPVLISSEKAYVCIIRERWPDAELTERTSAFVTAFHAFWLQHSRLLHLRNALSDQHDRRMIRNRIDMARPVIGLLGRQMDAPRTPEIGTEFDLASVLFTGLERVVTIATDEDMKATFPSGVQPRFEGATLTQQARVLALAIADQRAVNRAD